MRNALHFNRFLQILGDRFKLGRGSGPDSVVRQALAAICHSDERASIGRARSARGARGRNRPLARLFGTRDTGARAGAEHEQRTAWMAVCPHGRTCVSRTEGTALGARASLQDRKCHQPTRPRVGTLTGTLEATASAPRWAQKWAFSSESVPVAQPPTAAGQLYGEQVTPVAAVAQSMVSGIVQPELANAVAARTSPRTTLYFKRDMTTPVHERRNVRPRGVILRECNAECYGIHQICDRPRVKR